MVPFEAIGLIIYNIHTYKSEISKYNELNNLLTIIQDSFSN